MAAAYIRAGELSRAGGKIEPAFAAYQQRFGSFVLMKQRAARRFAGMLAPKSRFSLLLGQQIMRLLTIGWIADLAVGREFRDRITLPDY